MKKKLKSLSDTLPDEVVEEILTRTAAKSVTRFKRVNSGWYNLLTSNQRFVKNHLGRMLENEGNHGFILQAGPSYYFIPDDKIEEAVKLDTSCVKMPFHNPDGMAIVGSCNGLVCLINGMWPISSISIWNPVTRDCDLLPCPNIVSKEGTTPYYLDNHDALGFGFDPNSNDYKVVRLVRALGVDRVSRSTSVEIYSSKTSSWRELKGIHYLVLDKYSRCNINGVLHWFGSCERRLLIILFDVINEVFREVQVPDFLDINDFKFMSLRMFRNCLSILVVIPGEKMLHSWVPNIMCVWVMNDYPAQESWALLYTIHKQSPPYPIGFLRNGKALLVDFQARFITYKSESRTWNIIGNPKLIQFQYYEPACYGLVPYVETVVPVTPTYHHAEAQQRTGEYLESVELSSHNFDDVVLKSKELWIVEFCADSTTWSRQLEHKWKKAENQLKRNVKLGHIDCGVDKSLMCRLSVKDLPTFLVFGDDKGSPFQYGTCKLCLNLLCWRNWGRWTRK